MKCSLEEKRIIHCAVIFKSYNFCTSDGRPRGLMDMASDFGSEDCGFESRRGQCFYL